MFAAAGYRSEPKISVHKNNLNSGKSCFSWINAKDDN